MQLLAPDLHEGEAEALAQAQEKHVSFFIADEKRAREIGRNMGLTPVGTARLLARLHAEGLADEPRRLVSKLRKDLRFRIADEVVDEVISAALEPI